jgi:ABC-type protease/lipase transport system fused ATPase/permease subunit
MRHRYLGYLPQDIQLLDGTIVDNISRFGKPVPEDIVATAQLAGVHDMILRMPENYGARIGTDGMLLSAGQRQRLALARALYGNPAFVALDEPCAHLDETSERMLMQTLGALRKRGVTVCIVSHKANLVRMADLVLVLNTKGHARLGTPNDLFRPTLRPVTTDGRRIAS